jgi:hypothetical protein
MPLTTASAVTVFYAIGYAVATLAVTAMTRPNRANARQTRLCRC